MASYHIYKKSFAFFYKKKRISPLFASLKYVHKKTTFVLNAHHPPSDPLKITSKIILRIWSFLHTDFFFLHFYSPFFKGAVMEGNHDCSPSS